MRIGVLKEIKTKEHRVAVTPEGVEQMLEHGHEVFVEIDAGNGSDFYNEDYEKAGATICRSPEEIYRECEMIMKVKEPLSVEYPLIQKGQILFTYFHFAASMELNKAIMDSGAVAVAYETVEKKDGSLPLLTPMSEVAGRLSIQEGAKYLEKTYGGCGVLLSGVPGVEPGTVLIIGGGIVGTRALNEPVGVFLGLDAAGVEAHLGGGAATLTGARFKRGEWLEAERYARQLRSLEPDSNLARRVLQGIKTLRESGVMK